MSAPTLCRPRWYDIVKPFWIPLWWHEWDFAKTHTSTHHNHIPLHPSLPLLLLLLHPTHPLTNSLTLFCFPNTLLLTYLFCIDKSPSPSYEEERKTQEQEQTDRQTDRKDEAAVTAKGPRTEIESRAPRIHCFRLDLSLPLSLSSIFLICNLSPYPCHVVFYRTSYALTQSLLPLSKLVYHTDDAKFCFHCRRSFYSVSVRSSFGVVINK